jgi:hypothetical protein
MKKYGIYCAVSIVALASILFLASCGGSGSDGSAGVLGNSAINADDGFTLMLDPLELVIDLTDPNTPVDPVSGLHFGEVMLTANADDLATDIPQEGLEVTFSAAAGSLLSQGAVVLTDVDGNALDTLTVTEDDPGEIEVMATDGERMEVVTLIKTMIFPNRPPVAEAGADLLSECSSLEGTPVILDGSGSTDPDSTAGTNDDIVLFSWYTGFGTAEELLLGEGMTLEVALDLGAYVITLQVTDSEGETASDEITVEIVDTTPPTLSFHLDPDSMWPPNHRMWDIEAMVVAEDACSEVTVALVSVSSNEPDNGLGDGDTDYDIQSVEAGTEDYHFQLRAERAGGGSGRIYSVLYSATDGAGFMVEASGEVVVPHDQD